MFLTIIQLFHFVEHDGNWVVPLWCASYLTNRCFRKWLRCRKWLDVYCLESCIEMKQITIIFVWEETVSSYHADCFPFIVCSLWQCCRLWTYTFHGRWLYLTLSPYVSVILLTLNVTFIRLEISIAVFRHCDSDTALSPYRAWPLGSMLSIPH